MRASLPLNSSLDGYTSFIGGIGGDLTKYTVVKYNGFNEIETSAHELGHRYFKYILVYVSVKISWCLKIENFLESLP